MNKNFTALIIDSNPDLSQRFISVVDKVFTEVYLQPSEEQVEKDLVEFKPSAIFLNLNIDQRQSAFALLEKLPTMLESMPLVFAYMDGHEPELIAHCFENGILDVFMRPFDADLIASKINRALRNEVAAVEKNLTYTKLLKPLSAEVKFSGRLAAVDENGLTLICDHYVSKGSRLKITSSLMEEIFGTATIRLMVSKTWFDEHKSIHFLYAEPPEQKESQSAGLRRFIMRKNEN
jgi:DNA-binding response OmpR family regulator